MEATNISFFALCCSTHPCLSANMRPTCRVIYGHLIPRPYFSPIMLIAPVAIVKLDTVGGPTGTGKG